MCVPSSVTAAIQLWVRVRPDCLHAVVKGTQSAAYARLPVCLLGCLQAVSQQLRDLLLNSTSNEAWVHQLEQQQQNAATMQDRLGASQ
jgi:hypothetical protein